MNEWMNECSIQNRGNSGLVIIEKKKKEEFALFNVNSPNINITWLHCELNA